MGYRLVRRRYGGLGLLEGRAIIAGEHFAISLDGVEMLSPFLAECRDRFTHALSEIHAIFTVRCRLN
jgi:hypothetical protein